LELRDLIRSGRHQRVWRTEVTSGIQGEGAGGRSPSESEVQHRI